MMFNTIETIIMANYKNLEMAHALLSHVSLSEKSSLFGLRKHLVYLPTGSPVKVMRVNYHIEAKDPLLRIINSTDGKSLAAAVKAFHAAKQDIGNLELDVCVSADKQFVALQLMQFMDYANRPVSQPAFYEGEQAQLVAQII